MHLQMTNLKKAIYNNNTQVKRHTNRLCVTFRDAAMIQILSIYIFYRFTTANI